MKERPTYLDKYHFNWDLFDIVLSGRSSVDMNTFMGKMSTFSNVDAFLQSYGYEYNDPVSRAELFGNFQEALEFIRKYFLKKGNPQGLDLSIPARIYEISDIREIFLMASGEVKDQSVEASMDEGKSKNRTHKGEREEKIWAGIILKIMHTINHVDKDLRHNYFPIIQQQILDRFYKFLKRDESDQLFLSAEGDRIPLVNFQPKVKKSRDSVIIKLLHKVDNVAEELFDRIGVRFVTHNRLDILRVIKFMHDQYIVMPHNVKPSRSLNTLIDIKHFKKSYWPMVKKNYRENYNEQEFISGLEKVLKETEPEKATREYKNELSLEKYRSVQFTCRQLIKYREPFISKFVTLRKMALDLKGEGEDNALIKNILSFDFPMLSKEVRFFYPYEIQIVDLESYHVNSKGEAGHTKYKEEQLRSAMQRIFRPLLELKNM